MSPQQHNNYAPELTTALRAVHLASLLTKSHLLHHLATSGVSASTKSDSSEVTTADFASQAIIISVIHHAFPDDVFIAEESGEMLREDAELRERVWKVLGSVGEVQRKYSEESRAGEQEAPIKLPETIEEMIQMIDLGQIGGRSRQQNDAEHTGANATATANGSKPSPKRTWILDPIDGTKTYIRGHQYVVCLCLVENGEQQVAVLGCPNLTLDERDNEGRVVVQDDLVDLSADGGWIVSCIKGHGVDLSRMRTPRDVKPLEEVIGWDESTTATATETTNGGGDRDRDRDRNSDASEVKLRFTDSTASPHVCLPIHQTIFTHFSPSPSTSLATPATPLNIWSMQLKFVLLALRASHADALIRCPPDPNYHASVWDHAGGQLSVRESGGVLSDARGVEFVLDGGTRKLEGNWGVVAVRGGWAGEARVREVHGVVLERVRVEVERREKERGNTEL